MSDQRKDEATRQLVGGRVEELRRLEACERALAVAFHRYSIGGDGRTRLLVLGERHRQIAGLLAERLEQLGGAPDRDPDDLWIIDSPTRLETLIWAEETALRTYHDHLLDLDGDTRRLVIERVLPLHEETLERLIAERHRLHPLAAPIWESR